MIATLVAALVSVTTLLQASGPPPPRSTLEVVVDPRIELLAAVQVLADYGWTGLITRHEFPYEQALRAHVEAHRDHEAVALFKEMAAGGFTFDAPVTVMVHLGDVPGLEPTAPIPPDIVARAGGAARLEAFLDALRDFARVSAIEGFVDARRNAHEAMIEGARARLEGIDVETLESYYGVRQGRYVIVLAPLLHPGGFGPRVQRPDGTTDVYSVIGPQGVGDEMPTFGAPDDFRYLVWHEFSHSFVNPVVDRFGDEVDRCDVLFAPIRGQMRRQAYGQWRTCVYEHVVRAVTCRLTQLELGPDAGATALEYERSRGFVHVEDLCAALEAYEGRRERYPMFADYFPELLAVLERLAAEAAPVAEVAGAAPRVVRTIPDRGDPTVDPSLAELLVEFDRDMKPSGYSWVQRNEETFPRTTGGPYWKSPRMCALPVALEPGRAYWVGLNVGPFGGFHDVDGRSAEPYVLEFRTAGGDE